MGSFVVKLHGVKADKPFLINNYLWMTLAIILMKCWIMTIIRKLKISCVVLVVKMVISDILMFLWWSWLWCFSVSTVLWPKEKKFKILPRPYLGIFYGNKGRKMKNEKSLLELSGEAETIYGRQLKKYNIRLLWKYWKFLVAAK